MFSEKAFYFISFHFGATFIFAILYWFQDKFHIRKKSEPKDGFAYWLWFSTITQTTVGYSGIETSNGIPDQYNKISSNIFKFINFAQLFSIFIITAILI